MGKIELGLGVAVLLLLLRKRQWFYWRMLWLLQSFDLRFGKPSSRREEQDQSAAPPLYKASGL